ncbi:MAG TPA: HK97 family phage prohead protease [Candidatus Acidoferrum sp.]|jgi:HK97 family phage prohead protease
MKSKEFLKAFSDAHRIKTGELVYRGVNVGLRTLNESDRTIEMVASTESPDRYGDVIRVAGWKLDNFQKNPVFLFSHRSEDPPIGRIVASKKEGGANPALVQTVQFATKDVYPFADTIFKMYKGGFMNATSVGFMSIESQPIVDKKSGNVTGYEFLEQELFELSAVPVPANPQALARMQKSMTGGFNLRGMLTIFLSEAVERSIVSGDEASRFEKSFALCGDKNPPWAYSVAGVTYDDSPDPVGDILASAGPRDTLDKLMELLQ